MNLGGGAMSLFAQWQIRVCLGNQFESIFPVPFHNISGLKIVQQSLFLYFPDKYAFTEFTLPLKCLWSSIVFFLKEKEKEYFSNTSLIIIWQRCIELIRLEFFQVVPFQINAAFSIHQKILK